MLYVGADVSKGKWFAVGLGKGRNWLAKGPELCSIPKKADFDSRGLPMEMVYRFLAK